MHNESIQQEAFSISFNGPAFDGHDIPAAALAQSLLALDGLSRRAAEAAYQMRRKTPPFRAGDIRRVRR
ncbi:MAG: hypothetical protein IJT59_02820 [Desulfovibrionaceae bacterium]|nr:hypothetical protein [Desulfovibrionaceae bacterium]